MFRNLVYILKKMSKNVTDCFQLLSLNLLEHPFNLLYTFALTLIIIYGAIINTILIYASIKTNSQKIISSQKCFIVLSVSDLWTILIALPIQIYIANYKKEINCLLSQIQIFTAIHTAWYSGLMISIITFTRYVKVATTKTFIQKNLTKNFILYLNILLATSLSLWCSLSYFYKSILSLALYYFLSGIVALILLTLVIFVNYKMILY